MTVLCVSIVLKYIEHTHCKSVVHLTNLKYCDEQQQTCSLNSRLENHINHNDIDEQVKELIEHDVKHNLVQQSVIDAIRTCNIHIGNAMQENV